MNLQPILSRGWEISQPFPIEGAIVTVTNGAGVGATSPILLLSKEVPPAARIYVEKLSVRVVDQAAYDQLYFALRRNAAVVNPWHKISGETVVDDHFIPIEREFESGLIELTATNISATTETGASGNALDIRVVARLYAYLLRYVGR